MAEGNSELPQHLEFIQNVVERHARNSFLLKGWSITLVAAIFLLAVRGAEPVLAMMAGLLPALTFWGLDAYYLRQERKYRALYDHVRHNTVTENDRFTLDAKPFAAKVDSWIKTLFAATVFWFHAVIMSVVIAALAFFTLRTGHGT